MSQQPQKDQNARQIPLIFTITLLVLVSPLIGIIIDNVLQHGISDFIRESPNSFLVIFLVIFSSVFVLQAYVVFSWRSMRIKIDQLYQSVDEYYKESRIVDANIVDYKRGYDRLTEWVRNAKKEVLILNYSPDGGYSSGIQHIPNEIRSPLFDAYREVIENPSIKFQRIIQLDQKDYVRRNLWNTLDANNDRLTRLQCEVLAELQSQDRRRSFLKVSPVCIHSTFALVDGCKLFLRLDYKRPNGDKYENSLILLAEDNTGQAFEELIKNYHHIESHPETFPVRPEDIGDLG